MVRSSPLPAPGYAQNRKRGNVSQSVYHEPARGVKTKCDDRHYEHGRMNEVCSQADLPV